MSDSIRDDHYGRCVQCSLPTRTLNLNNEGYMHRGACALLWWRSYWRAVKG